MIVPPFSRKSFLTKVFHSSRKSSLCHGSLSRESTPFVTKVLTVSRKSSISHESPLFRMKVLLSLESTPFLTPHFVLFSRKSSNNQESPTFLTKVLNFSQKPSFSHYKSNEGSSLYSYRFHKIPFPFFS